MTISRFFIPAALLAAFTFGSTDAQAGTTVHVRPGTVQVSVNLGRIWVPGYWTVTATGRRSWVAGAWRVPPRPGAIWVPGHYVGRGPHQRWVNGHWQ